MNGDACLCQRLTYVRDRISQALIDLKLQAMWLGEQARGAEEEAGRRQNRRGGVRKKEVVGGCEMIERSVELNGRVMRTLRGVMREVDVFEVGRAHRLLERLEEAGEVVE